MASRSHSPSTHTGVSPMTDPPTLSVSEVVGRLAQETVTAAELTAQCLAKIDQLDGDLRAFTTVEADQARQRASEADAEIQSGQRKGPLHGIPIGVKDNLSVAGRVTTMGSANHRDNVTDEDAGVVERADAAGTVRIGKTNLHEYALGVTTENPHFGICRNPWDRTKTPGDPAGVRLSPSPPGWHWSRSARTHLVRFGSPPPPAGLSG